MGCHLEAEKENAGGETSKMPENYNIYKTYNREIHVFWGFIHFLS